MKPSTIPVICSLSMAAMLAAGASHWWSVHQFTAMLEHGMLQLPSEPAAIAHSPAPAKAQTAPKVQSAPQTQAPSFASFNQADSASQKAFYEALIEKMKQVETQNRDLLDQLAETNRDLMKLEFRVDTHSESFRPLPVAEERPFTSLDTGSGGVLPPRATPAEQLPSFE